MFGSGICQFICLNPSTADEVQDDPTVRRCIDYADRWGYRWFCMTNIFAWRDTDPEAMKLVPEPVAEDGSQFGNWNDSHIIQVAQQAERIVCAWGKHATHRGRGVRVVDMLLRASVGRLSCLKLNDDGSPQHPLYLSKELKPLPFP